MMEMMWSVWLCAISLLAIGVTKFIYRWWNPECKGILPPDGKFVELWYLDSFAELFRTETTAAKGYGLRAQNNGSNVTAIAFGGGNRTCAGAEFSKVMMAVFLHVLVTKYRTLARWSKIKGGDVVRAPVLGFTNGFYIKVSEKQA
ncbi:Uncharacterized protein TCM_034381 [Theobroma cacao]|uniref:Cytochrome P450 n=1 Tax=Theobroma cacao TaxID=3641 RepID=A0A061FDX6_THECC|nr:Uncharacterized protein TCM_034381 [Theobroma cacao]